MSRPFDKKLARLLNTRPTTKESEIQSTVLDAAAKLGFLVVRVKSGERKRSAAVRWNSLTGSWVGPGHPDAVLYLNGRAWFIEFKRDNKGKLRIEQSMFRAMADSVRVPFHVVSSMAQGLNLLQDLRSEARFRVPQKPTTDINAIIGQIPDENEGGAGATTDSPGGAAAGETDPAPSIGKEG